MAENIADDLEWALAFIDQIIGERMPPYIKPGTHAERYHDARRRLALWQERE
jgi:hypothetical protein